MTDNPNAPNKNGNTPILEATRRGYTEIVKILAPLTKNPNAHNKYGITPIHCARSNGHTEIVQILTPLPITIFTLLLPVLVGGLHYIMLFILQEVEAIQKL